MYGRRSILSEKKVDSCKYSGHPVMQHEFLIRSIKAQKKLKYDLN